MMDYWSRGYLSPERWLSFERQIDLIRSTGSRTVLEIGAGPQVVACTLRHMGLEVSTLDRDHSLRPDFLGDVRTVAEVVPTESFDCVLAAQVLEHIPWEDLPETLDQIGRVSKRWCVLSVPYSGITLLLSLRWGRHRFHNWWLGTRFPAWWRGRKYFAGGDHRWELGTRHHTRAAFRRLLSQRFRIVREERDPSRYHMIFYLCEVRPER